MSLERRGGGAVPLTEVNTRLIDVISASGGVGGRTEDLIVRLSRRGTTRTVPLQTLYENPRFNVIMQPGDVVAIEAADRKFTVLGAGGSQTLRFDEQEVSLAEALSLAGGLQSGGTHQTGVFIYRRVPRDVLASVGADVTHIPGLRGSHRLPVRLYRSDGVVLRRMHSTSLMGTSSTSRTARIRPSAMCCPSSRRSCLPRSSSRAREIFDD